MSESRVLVCSISYPEPSLPLSSGTVRVLGADQKKRGLWERDYRMLDIDVLTEVFLSAKIIINVQRITH